MANISLIPKKGKKRGLPGIVGGDQKVRFDIWGKVAVALLIVVILTGGAFFIWNKSVKSEKKILQNKLQNLKAERDATLEKEITQTSTMVNAFEGLLKDHRHWSDFFAVIEDRSIPGVVFTELKAFYDTASISLKGLAQNYTILAKQIKSLEEEENINRVDVSDVELNKEGEVEFSVDLNFKKELIK